MRDEQDYTPTPEEFSSDINAAGEGNGIEADITAAPSDDIPQDGAQEPPPVSEFDHSDGEAVQEEYAQEDGAFLQETSDSDPIQAAPATKASDPIWTRVRRAIFGTVYSIDDAEFVERLNQLNEAIERAPQTPSNFVLRGELYLEAGLYELARDDFRHGYALAAAQYERSSWGILAQVMADRALVGLQKAEKKLLA